MLLLLAVVVALLYGCAPGPGPSVDESARREVEANQEQRDFYIPRQDLEFQNYNKRVQLADDPTTILWCTFFPPMGGAQQVFTVPVIGKLTSSGKRPFPVQISHDADYALGARYSLGGGYYSNEAIQPDGMYGGSSEYRYGFAPDGTYSDFTDLPSFCTTAPTVWQMNETRVVTQIDEDALAHSAEAQQLLRSGDVDGALDILQALGE